MRYLVCICSLVSPSATCCRSLVETGVWLIGRFLATILKIETVQVIHFPRVCTTAMIAEWTLLRNLKLVKTVNQTIDFWATPNPPVRVMIHYLFSFAATTDRSALRCSLQRSTFPTQYILSSIDTESLHALADLRLFLGI